MKARISTLAWVSGLIIAVAVSTPGRPAALATAETPQVLTKADLDARRDRIRRFFQARLERLEIIATTVTPSGQTIDWIVPRSQTAGGTIATPPAVDYADPPAPGARQAQTEVELYPSARGPAGTVPMVRFDVERYLALVPVPPENPSQVVATLTPPAPEANKRYYVSWKTSATNYGTGGVINIWDTTGPDTSNETSIVQTAVKAYTGLLRPNGTEKEQTVEAGKLEFELVNGDRAAHFFTFYTTNGYGGAGDWLGGYNDFVDGWIQVSPTRSPGMLLTASQWTPRIPVPGVKYAVELLVAIYLWQGNWWVKAGSEWVGYYPQCKGGGMPPCGAQGTLFSSPGLRDAAEQVYWLGEVFDASAPNPTSTDMGNGNFGSNRYHQVAYFRNMSYWWDPMHNWWLSAGSLHVTDSACYDGVGPTFNLPSPTGPRVYNAWTNYFTYGGPGKEAIACR